MARNCRATTKFVSLILLVASVTVQTSSAEDQSKPAPFDAAQTLAIQEIMRDYLVSNPEVLIEALKVYQEQQELAAEERQRKALKTERRALVDDPGSPVLGNPNGDVTLVEFIDYQCPYCKAVAAQLRRAVEEDGKIRLIMKELPILGAGSQFAARAALAAMKQDRYEDFHFALMEVPGKLAEENVLATAIKSGLDVERLKRDMQAEEIAAALRRNFELAQKLGITGTPAFVISEQLIPGAISMEHLHRLVTEVRNGPS